MWKVEINVEILNQVKEQINAYMEKMELPKMTKSQEALYIELPLKLTDRKLH